MEVGQVVYTATVFYGEKPFVHFAKRTISAVLPTGGYVVDAAGHPTVVMKAEECHATQAGAAARAIDKLRGSMAKIIEVYLDQIQEVEKTGLQDASLSV
jgi:hypothetical protein